LLLVGLAASSLAARAELISLDSPFGAGTVTLDTETGLQWLDLDITAGRSFNDISGELGVGGEFEGYRFATTDEVLDLWTHAGIPDITFEGPIEATDFTAANLEPAQALVGLIGVTLNSPFGPLSEGYTATAPVGDETLRIVGELNICVEPLCQFVFPNQIDVALASLGPNTKGVDEVVNFIGSYLVRSAVAAIGGSAAQTFNQYAVCRDLTSGQTVVIAPLAGSPAWDCTANGLAPAPGDQVLQVLKSIAVCGPGNPCAITGTVSGVEDVLAVCRNLSTSQTSIAALGDGTFDCAAAGFSAITGESLQIILRGDAPAALPACIIDFETGCPDAGAQCGASFAGGTGCRIAGLPFCYSTGVFAYEIGPAATTTITLDGDLWSLDVFFASGGPGQGSMTFFDAAGDQVDAPLLTNGDCSLAMPLPQRVNFSRPVRRIVVENGGPSNIYVDTFSINPQ
jgi:hypothetical protein